MLLKDGTTCYERLELHFTKTRNSFLEMKEFQVRKREPRMLGKLGKCVNKVLTKISHIGSILEKL